MSGDNVVKLDSQRREHCEACGKDMPRNALVAFNPEPDVTQFVCGDTESCGARVAGSQEIDLLVVHARVIAKKLAADLRESFGAPERGLSLSEVASRVEHIAAVLARWNANRVSGTGFRERPAWADEKQQAMPAARSNAPDGLIPFGRQIIARLEEVEDKARRIDNRTDQLESWAEAVARYLADDRPKRAVTLADAETHVFPKVKP